LRPRSVRDGSAWHVFGAMWRPAHTGCTFARNPESSLSDRELMVARWIPFQQSNTDQQMLLGLRWSSRTRSRIRGTQVASISWSRGGPAIRPTAGRRDGKEPTSSINCRCRACVALMSAWVASLVGALKVVPSIRVESDVTSGIRAACARAANFRSAGSGTKSKSVGFVALGNLSSSRNRSAVLVRETRGRVEPCCDEDIRIQHERRRIVGMSRGQS
jgi:hypothetical protein